METEIVIACFALIGTMFSSFVGGVMSSRLTRHRISELEKKVDKHNKLVERMQGAEDNIKFIYSIVDDLKKGGVHHD